MATKEGQPIVKRSATEVVTPHKVALTILIRNFCIYREEDEFKNLDGVQKCLFRRDFCVLMLRLLQSPEIPLLELYNLLTSKKYHIPHSLFESFDNTLSYLNKEGIGSLMDITESLQKIINRPDDPMNTLISKSSIIGYYLRRFIVYFDILKFSEFTILYEDFQRYYEEMHRSSKFKNNQEENLDQWCGDREQWSRRQAELFIATQATLLANNEGKALPPPELQKQIRSILESNPDLSGAHFLLYLNYLRVDEYCGALDSLLHSFDRNVDPCLKSYNDEKSKRHRFAALNLAILHYHFGHVEEALAALKESIQISQEANDNVCLQHALSWLYRLTTVNEDKLIIHCILKSSELNLSYTTSLGLQTFAQLGCLHTGKNYAILETLTKSDMINCQYNYKDLTSYNYSMKAALWQFYGKTEMCSLWSQLLLYQNMDSLPPSKAFYGEGFCLAVCNIANNMLLQGEYALVFCILAFAKQRFPHEPHSHLWMLSENLFHFTRALYREQWAEAVSAAQKIMVLDKWEGYLRLAEAYFYKQDYVEADNCVEMLLKQYQLDITYKFRKKYYYVRAKILKAEIQFACNFPTSVPSGMITTLNDSLIESQAAHFDFQSILVQLQIANCMLAMGNAGQALAVLDRCLVQILGHGGRYDRARAMLLYVKCQVADSNRLAAEERGRVILEGVEVLQGVKRDFEKVEAFSRVQDVLFLQSQLYDALGMRTERNKCASEFKLLNEEQLPKNVFTLVKYV